MVNKQKTKRKETAASDRAKSRELRGVFHAAGLRLTKQRLTIYRELESCPDHPDVDYLFRAVRRIVPKISLFTVYRTMNALESAGMVWRVATCKGHARYDGNVEAHAHFLCEKCGRIDDVDTHGACHQMPELARKCVSGSVHRVAMMIVGECADCLAAPAVPPEA